jgi:hypothetical protein
MWLVLWIAACDSSRSPMCALHLSQPNQVVMRTDDTGGAACLVADFGGKLLDIQLYSDSALDQAPQQFQIALDEPEGDARRKSFGTGEAQAAYQDQLRAIHCSNWIGSAIWRSVPPDWKIEVSATCSEDGAQGMPLFGTIEGNIM